MGGLRGGAGTRGLKVPAPPSVGSIGQPGQGSCDQLRLLVRLGIQSERLTGLHQSTGDPGHLWCCLGQLATDHLPEDGPLAKIRYGTGFDQQDPTESRRRGTELVSITFSPKGLNATSLSRSSSAVLT